MATRRRFTAIFPGIRTSRSAARCCWAITFRATSTAPYTATDPQDFWQRWHISLSSWLRDYLYIPLGGSRGGSGRTYVNLMITMLLGGLWHGASWTFVMWGGLQGLYLLRTGFGRRYRSPGLERFRATKAWMWVSRAADVSCGVRGLGLLPVADVWTWRSVCSISSAVEARHYGECAGGLTLVCGLLGQYAPRRWRVGWRRRLARWPAGVAPGVALALGVFAIEVLRAHGCGAVYLLSVLETGNMMRWHKTIFDAYLNSPPRWRLLRCARCCLESGGLYDWAQRLELGPLRSVALPVATRLHRGGGCARWAGAAAEQERLQRWRALGGATTLRRRRADTAACGWDACADSVTLQSGAIAGASRARCPGDETFGCARRRAKAVPVRRWPAILRCSSELPAMLGRRCSDGRCTVALAGDSMMAVGLSATMLRVSRRSTPACSFVKAFKSGTGLSRPEVFNWQKEYPAMLAAGLGAKHKPDVVLVAIGANDGQGFVEDGVTYPFGSDGWKTIYERRVTAYLHMLEATGAQVIWLGLPPMKSESYEGHIALVNRIAYTVVSADKQASWFSIGGLLGDKDGAFRDFGAVGGKQVRLRASDGIHMSVDGASLITDKLLPWLSPPQPAAATTPPAAATPPHTEVHP